MQSIYIIGLFAFVFISAFISLSSISFFSLSQGEVKLLSKSPDYHKNIISKLLSHPGDLLTTLLFCDILANILIQNFASNLFSSSNSWTLKVGFPLFISLFFCEFLPKTIALPYNYSIAISVSRIINILNYILTPLQIAVSKITSGISKRLLKCIKPDPTISEDDLKKLLSNFHTGGIISKEEASLINGYLYLSSCCLKEKMKKRDEISFIDLNTDITTIKHELLIKKNKTCLICNNELQNIIGTLPYITFVKNKSIITSKETLLQFIKPPTYLAETISVRTAIKKMIEIKNNFCIVLDEYGAVSGTIYLHQLLEEVLRRDLNINTTKSNFTLSGNGSIIAGGKFELKDFEEFFHKKLPSESGIKTIGGWLAEQLDTIPKIGTKYQWQNFLFHVLAADANRVRRVYIKKLRNK